MDAFGLSIDLLWRLIRLLSSPLSPACPFLPSFLLSTSLRLRSCTSPFGQPVAFDNLFKVVNGRNCSLQYLMGLCLTCSC